MNDLSTYLETYYEVVSYIERYLRDSDNDYDDDNTIIINRHKSQGHGGLYELAKEWNDDFEKIYNDKEWDGEWLDTIEDFLIEKNHAV